MRALYSIILCMILCLNIVVYAQSESIYDSEISPGGDRLAVADDRGVWIYMLPDLDVEAVLPVAANGVSWSPDNDLLAVGAQSGEVLEWTISTGTAIRRTGHTNPVLDVEWAANGDYIASVSRDSIRAWQVGIYGDSIFNEETPYNDYAGDVAISPDGQMLCSGSVAGQLTIWATEGRDSGASLSTTNSIELQRQGLPIFEETAFCTWSQDTQRFVGTYSDLGRDDSQAMVVYDSSEIPSNRSFWEELFDIDVEDVTAAPMFNPDREQLALVHDTRVDILDSLTWSVVQTINSNASVINVDWTPNNKIVILTTGPGIEFHDLWTETTVLMLNHGDVIAGGQLNGSQFITAGGETIQAGVISDPPVAVASVESDVIPLPTPVNPAWLRNTDTITAGNASQLTLLQTLDIPFAYDTGWYFDWSPDGRVLVAGGGIGHTSFIWFVEDEAGLSDPVRVDFGGDNVSFSRDGRLFALVNPDNIKIWDIETREEVQVINPSGSTITEDGALSPGGTRLITGDRSDRVQIWDVASGELIDELDAPAWVRSVAYSPDGQWIAGGMDDGAVLVWDANTLERVLSLRFEPDRSSDGVEIYELEFTPDGQYLAGYDIGVDALAIWEIPSGESIPVETDVVNASEVAFHPSQPLLTAIHSNHIWVMDYTSGEILYDEQTGSLYATGRTEVYTAAFPDDDSLIYFGTSYSQDGFEVWDWQSNQMLASFTGTEETELTRGIIRLHPGGALVAVQDGGSRINLYGLR